MNIEKQHFYIYKRTNLINGMIYIGQTINSLELRWRQEDRSNQAIGKAVKKFGSENFKNELIEEVNSKEEMNERERYWIAYYNSNNPEKGYNKTKGGSGGNGHINGKVICWKSKKYKFLTEKSLVNYIFSNQITDYTYCQIARFVRIGLRLKNLKLKLFDETETLLDFFLLKEISEMNLPSDIEWTILN